jgi:hypothetical protein
MADYTFGSLTTAQIGVEDSILFDFNLLTSYTIQDANGTIPVGNMNISSLESSVPGFFVGRRPQTGQVFPRGVYNK